MQRPLETHPDQITVSVPSGLLTPEALYFGIWSMADAAWGVEPFDVDVRSDGACAVLRASLPALEQARREAIDDAADLAALAGDS